MIAEVQNLVAHIGHIGVEIGGVGPSLGVGLKELVPKQDAVFVAKLVEVLAGALADPVADQVKIRKLVHVDFRVESFPGNALEGFIKTPVAAADEYARSVDGDGEVLGIGHAIGDFADAEGHILPSEGCLFCMKLRWSL